MHNRQRKEKYYNRTVKDMDFLKEGDSVRVQLFEPQRVWRAAKMIRPSCSHHEPE